MSKTDQPGAVDGAVKGGVFDDFEEIRRQKQEEQKQALLAEAKAEEIAAAQNAVKPEAAKPEGEVAAEVKPSVPEAAAPTVDALRAEIAQRDARLQEMQRQIDSETGRRGHDLDLIRQDRAKLAEMLDQQSRANQEMSQKMAALEARLANPPPAPEPEFTFSDAVRDSLGEDAVRLEQEIRRSRAAQKAVGAADPNVTKEIASLREATTAAQRAAETTARNQYIRDLKTLVPNYEQLVAMPEYNQFFVERMRGTPYKRGDLIADADKNMDVQTVADHLAEFAEKIKAPVVATAKTVVARPTAAETVDTTKGAAVVTASPKPVKVKLTAAEIASKQAEADRWFDVAVGSGATSREDRVKAKAKSDALYAEVEAAKQEK